MAAVIARLESLAPPTEVGGFHPKLNAAPEHNSAPEHKKSVILRRLSAEGPSAMIRPGVPCYGFSAISLVQNHEAAIKTDASPEVLRFAQDDRFCKGRYLE